MFLLKETTTNNELTTSKYQMNRMGFGFDDQVFGEKSETRPSLTYPPLFFSDHVGGLS